MTSMTRRPPLKNYEVLDWLADAAAWGAEDVLAQVGIKATIDELEVIARAVYEVLHRRRPLDAKVLELVQRRYQQGRD